MIGPLPAVTPSDDLAAVLQAAAFGALIGTAVAARRRRRNPEFDAWLVTARWTVLLTVLSCLWFVAKGLR